MNTFQEIRNKLVELELENVTSTVMAQMCDGVLQFVVSNEIVLETNTSLVSSEDNEFDGLSIRKQFDDEFDFLNDGEPQTEIFMSF